MQRAGSVGTRNNIHPVLKNINGGASDHAQRGQKQRHFKQACSNLGVMEPKICLWQHAP